MLDNLHIYQQAITENLVERGELEDRFERDLARFKQLTNPDEPDSASGSSDKPEA